MLYVFVLNKIKNSTRRSFMSEKEIVQTTEKTFEDIKHIDENGAEFWYARELQIAKLT